MLIVEPIRLYDVVQLKPDPNAGTLSGLLAIVIGIAAGDIYTCESLQAGRCATLERVPGSALVRIGPAAFIRAGSKWTKAVGAS